VWNALLQEAWNVPLQGDLTRINTSLNTAKTMLATSGLPAADVSRMTTRLDAMLAERQVSKLVNWIIRPLMPGPWRNLTGDELTTARRGVHEAFSKIQTDQVLAVRALTLSFRSGGDLLYEAAIDDGNGSRGILAFIDKRVSNALSSRFVLLDGTSPPIHQMNGDSAPLLDTPARANDYFRFFLGAIHAELGPFSVVEKPEDLLWRRTPRTTSKRT
jgi:hypothetical protein